MIMMPLTIAPANLDGPCSLMSRNDARVHGPCSRHRPCSRLVDTAREHG